MANVRKRYVAATELRLLV